MGGAVHGGLVGRIYQDIVVGMDGVWVLIDFSLPFEISSSFSLYLVKGV